MDIVLDHVMIPAYFNNPLLELVEAHWKGQKGGRIQTYPQGPAFKQLVQFTKSFYVEQLSTVKSEPYWSNAVYCVVPVEFWDHYKHPPIRSEHFLVPQFGAGYALISPDYPHLNSKIAATETYDGLTVFISAALAKALTNIGGATWALPKNGPLKINPDLHHPTDIVIINERNERVAPLFQPNPLLRDYF